jgi:hypothetical protein
MKRPLLLGLTLLNLALPAGAASKAIVVVPFADLRSDQSSPASDKSDEKQQTQLLFGETVNVVISSGNWLFVQAIEQPEFTTHQKWEGYPGWVQKSAVLIKDEPFFDGFVSEKWLNVNSTLNDATLMMLPLGSHVRIISTAKNTHAGVWINLFNDQTGWIRPGTLRRDCAPDCRAKILETASLLIGDRYTWGGLTPSGLTDSMRLTGVDCSGLVHLAYRVNGMAVPRDSMDQYLKAKKIKRAQMKPADLVFSAKKDSPQKITHVALYAGWNVPPNGLRAALDGWIIEAPQTGMVVRKISFREKFGVNFDQVESGDTVGVRVIYFGRLIKN